MNWNTSIRQGHRWISMAFLLSVLAVIVVGALQSDPAEWVFYVPLPPLFLLMFTGAYLFVLPYFAKRKDGGE